MLGCLAVAVVLNLYFSTVGWNDSLRGPHEFRQAQTALSARVIQEEGWQPAYPLPLFGPPWSAPFEFPFYQVLVGKLAGWTGMGVEQAGRAISLLFLYLCLPAAYWLQEFLPIPRSRWLLLPALILLSPVYLYYSRSVMIESLALCAALWFLFAFARMLWRPGWLPAGATVVLGIIAGLAKSTTFLVFLATAGVLVLVRLRAAVRDGGRVPWPTLLGTGALVLPALAATVAWTRYADRIKAANPLASSLQSDHLREFVFGTAGQRFDAGSWGRIGEHLSVAVLNPANAMLLAVFGFLLVPRRGWIPAGLLVLGFAAGPLIFPNLYSVHDYYFYASGVFLLAALAVSWSRLLDQGQFSRAAACAVVGLSLALQAAGYARTYFQVQRVPPPPPPELALILREATAPRDIVLLIGEDWNPLVPYFAGRRAIMVRDDAMPHPEKLAAVLDRLEAGDRVTALVVRGEHRKYPDLIRALTTRLSLQNAPLFMDAGTHIYLTAEAAAEAAVRVTAQVRGSFTLIDNAVENLDMPRHRYTGAALADSRFRTIAGPGLEEVVHPFNLAFHEVEGHMVLDAHAPTDLIVAIPAGASEAALEFGILPAAWQASQPTDGIEYRVEYHPAVGRTQVLATHFIRPVENPADRLVKRVTVKLPAGAAGRLRLRTLPGPAGSIACDWAYWRKVEIR